MVQTVSSTAGIRPTYHVLDGMRGVAAISVVLLHATMFGSTLAPSAYLAPDLFFVLSGFVIALAYEDKLLNSMKVSRFLKIRVIRLYPMYAIGLFLGIYAAIASGSIQNMLGPVIFGTIFLPSTLSISGGKELFPLNIPSWTLFYEMVVNIIYAIFLPFLNTRRLIVVTIMMLTGIIGILLVRGTIAGGWNANLGHVLIGFIRVGFSFCVGVLIFRYREKIPNVKISASLILAVVAAVMMAEPTGHLKGSMEILCILILFPALVAFGTQSDLPRAFAGFFKILGSTSYGVYAIHAPILIIFGVYLPNYSGRYVEVAVVVSIIAVVIALDRWFDIPVRRYLSRVPQRTVIA